MQSDLAPLQARRDSVVCCLKRIRCLLWVVVSSNFSRASCAWVSKVCTMTLLLCCRESCIDGTKTVRCARLWCQMMQAAAPWTLSGSLEATSFKTSKVGWKPKLPLQHAVALPYALQLPSPCKVTRADLCTYMLNSRTSSIIGLVLMHHSMQLQCHCMDCIAQVSAGSGALTTVAPQL